MRKLSDTASIRITRHNIARLLTIITEKQRTEQSV
jgi:ribosomal protein L29